MVRPLPNPAGAGVHISPEYRTWFIAVVWPVERPRRNALLSALEGWAQVDVDNEVGTDEERLCWLLGQARLERVQQLGMTRRMLPHGGDGTPRLL
ncbi:hypothetical protein JCGZ_02885 [Jatropha curcas]|uniref:Uncharacterized protein n=1 Tax=Jatropha curcas TaxID=180498 RepID=A0A067JPV7_JATCU|nr:hypothetical protein JCGZ_02885 [Jatropha curcas]